MQAYTHNMQMALEHVTSNVIIIIFYSS